MQDFLNVIGAQPAEPTALAELDHASIIAPLSHYGLLAVSGPDSAKFLQGQLTCNVADVDERHSVPGAYCTPKGRMLASFQLARSDEHTYWLRMRADITAGTAAALGKYIVFSKARIDAAPALIPLGLHGPEAASAVRELGAVTQGRHQTAAVAGGLVVQLDDTGHWYECYLPQAEALALWQRCHGRFAVAGTQYWRWLAIRAGLAEVCAATVDLFIPQMLNLHLTGAVNFKKGCYTGQEIVARAQYRGQVKRHMYRIAVPGQAPAPTADLLGDGGQKLGTVVDSVQVDAQNAEMLAVLNETGADQLAANAVALRLLTLPYAIT